MAESACRRDIGIDDEIGLELTELIFGIMDRDVTHYQMWCALFNRLPDDGNDNRASEGGCLW